MQHGIKYVIFAETRIRTWVIAATTQCTNHYTISAHAKSSVIPHPCRLMGCSYLTKNKIFRRPECEPQKQYNISLLRSHYRASMMQHGIKYVIFAETRIRTWVIAATTQCTNHYTISAHAKSSVIPHPCRLMGCSYLTKNKIFRRPECEPQKQYNISLLPLSL